MRRALLLSALLAIAACAGARPAPAPAPAGTGSRLIVAYGGDGRGAIGPCG